MAKLARVRMAVEAWHGPSQGRPGLASRRTAAFEALVTMQNKENETGSAYD